MRRGISNTAALVASLSGRALDRAIEAAGGFHTPPSLNRELRRRMEREERQERKRVVRVDKHGAMVAQAKEGGAV